MNTAFLEPKPFSKDIGVLLVQGLQEGTKVVNIVVMSLIKVFQSNFNFQIIVY